MKVIRKQGMSGVVEPKPCPVCGHTKTNKGNPLVGEVRNQHMRSHSMTQAEKDYRDMMRRACKSNADDDEPDGAYWAMRLEGIY